MQVMARPTSKKSSKKSANNDGRPRPAREHLQDSVLKDLWSIWRADPRVPSIKSRHSWATARNANPRLVDQWFLRRKACAKKAGQPIPDDPYDISSEPSNVREHSATPGFDDAFPDLPSDDTLVYPADVGCSNDLDASSDTAFDEDMLMGSKRPETLAYKEVPRKTHQREPSSADLDALIDRCDNPLFSFPICNQGQGKQSSFTCVLCSSELAQDIAQPDSRTLFYSNQDPFIVYPHLDFSSTTLSELSAIPFLFRTPPAVPPNSAVSSKNVDDWTTIEEELGRLVRDGELDFSFLDVPHLSSMELLD